MWCAPIRSGPLPSGGSDGGMCALSRGGEELGNVIANETFPIKQFLVKIVYRRTTRKVLDSDAASSQVLALAIKMMIN
ncbi:unnamed protein product [Sympodiomycopsis kandeliae]